MNQTVTILEYTAPEPDFAVAYGFDMDAEVSVVQAAVERCRRANRLCSHYVEVISKVDDQRAWEVLCERGRKAADELNSAGKDYSEVKRNFVKQLLEAHGLGDLFPHDI